MLHSGSRGVGNRVGRHFIEIAKGELRKHDRQVPDQDLAWLEEGSKSFEDYREAVDWAQDYARTNRELMMAAALRALRKSKLVPRDFRTDEEAVNCHHNYVAKERHFGKDVWVTRKGAVRAGAGELGIIPGSMGARSFIVRGKGNAESFCSCSHGAGRRMSRTEAKKRFTLADHRRATEGVECRKDSAVIDETPAAYKDIDAVMAAQADLVEVVHTLKQVLCVKG
jgi:tRNA-splicing ligase RtcB (3'-phosphate/5'-hydroxy nucleic acid ligase)